MCGKGSRQKGVILPLRERQRDGRQARRAPVSRKLREESLFRGKVGLTNQKSTGKYWIYVFRGLLVNGWVESQRQKPMGAGCRRKKGREGDGCSKMGVETDKKAGSFQNEEA